MERSEVDTKGFAEWLREDERSENTVRSYEYAVSLFFGLYSEISKQNMISFKKRMLEEVSPSTADLRCIAMNRYCEFVGRQDCRVKTIRRIKPLSTENVISLQEYEKLKSGLVQDQDMAGYWMVVYLAKTGARVSELVQMKKEVLKKGYAELWTKGRVRRIYVPEQVLNESKSYFDKLDGDNLFVNRYGKPITREGVRERLQRYAERYGIRKEVMHPHSFRHLYAIQFLENDKDITLLKDLMGHADISTTARYTQITQEQQIKRLNEQAAKW